MNSGTLQDAVELGRRLGHFFVAWAGAAGFPHVSAARQIEPVSANQFAIEEWTCPLSLQRLSANPKIAVFIWDSSADEGYRILGEVLMLENQAVVNGFAPQVEANAHLPQVKRKLIIRAESIAAFRHAPGCGDLQPVDIPPAPVNLGEGEDGYITVPYCSFAPEWAEHARLDRSDEPCDDGRAGAV
jgi:hypothetical protein